MPKRLSKEKRPTDVNQFTQFLGERSTAEPKEATMPPTKSEISRIMSAMGRRGGNKSAKGRMEKISPEKRGEIALNAVRARWAKQAASKKS